MVVLEQNRADNHLLGLVLRSRLAIASVLASILMQGCDDKIRDPTIPETGTDHENTTVISAGSQPSSTAGVVKPSSATEPGADDRDQLGISLALSTVEVAETTIASGQMVDITLTLRDADGNILRDKSPEVAFVTSGGTSTGSFSQIIRETEGVYSTSFQGQIAGTASTIVAIIDGDKITSEAPSIEVTPGLVSLAQSMVTVQEAILTLNSSTTITLHARDAFGNSLIDGGEDVLFQLGVGTSSGIIASTVDHGDGSYSATFLGDTAGTPVSILATVNGNAVTNSAPTIEVVNRMDSQLFVSNSGSVGIGTMSPASKLSVNGGASFGAYSDNAAPTNGLIISGNVGIGTASPASTLHVQTGDVVGQTYTGPGGVGLNITSNDSAGAFFSYDINHSIFFRRGRDGVTDTSNYYQYGGPLAGGKGHRFYTGGHIQNQTLKFQIADDGTYLAGNLGIGTTLPRASLHVANGAVMPAVGNSSTSGIYFPVDPGGGNGDEAWLRYYVTSGETTKLMLGINNDATDTLGFYQMGAERMTISNGRVGIGTTSPNYMLHVNGSVAGVGAYNQLSDRHYKKDIANITNSIQKILAIHGVTYKWLDEEKFGHDTQIGVIAQEIERIVPEVVSTDSDGIKHVRYSDLIPLLIEAFKREHANRNAELAEKDRQISQLKAESELLKAAFCTKFPEMAMCAP